MVLYSIIAFGAAAVGGLGLAILHLRKQPVALPIAMVHGLVAATGLVLLILGYLQSGGGTLLLVTLILFLASAIGGFYLFTQRGNEQGLPRSALVVHALVAVTAYLLLLTAYFQS